MASCRAKVFVFFFILEQLNGEVIGLAHTNARRGHTRNERP